MKMLFARWSRNIVLSLLAFGIVCPVYSGPIEDAKNAGAVSGNTVQSLFGDKGSLNTNLSVPMTDNTSQMKTIDGNTSFSANLTSPSTASFLKILMQPAASGDLQVVSVSQDLDMDGNPDAFYTVPRLVSGVCANGYYSCDAGTWINCQPYKWVSDSTGKVSDVGAAITELGGCYCINSSCGSHLVWDNSALVLKDLGGGAVSAIQWANIGFTVTNVSLTPVTIDYYGRLVAGAAVGDAMQVQTLPPPVNAQAYYANPGAMSSSLGSIIATQSGDPGSIYYNMLNSSVVNQSSGEQKSCTINRTGGMSTASTTYSNSGTKSKCTDHFIKIQIWKVDDATYKLQVLDTGPGGDPYRNCGVGAVDSNGWYTIDTVNLPPDSAIAQGELTAASFNLPTMTGGGCNPGSGFVDGILNGFDIPINTTVSCPASGAQTVTFNWSYFFEYKLDTYVENVNDQCQALESDPTCTLKDEIVDGVQIYLNYNNTGLSQIPSCHDLVGAAGPMQICRPWWSKKRTYICTTNALDFSDLKKRYGAVVGGISQSGGMVTYDDQLKDASGNWSAGSGSILMPAADPAATCELSCRTRISHEDNEVTTTGIVSEMRTDPANATDYLYKLCVNGTCPVGTDEVIVDDCQCLSGFQEATLAIQSLRMAGKDTICTSGVRKPVQ